MRLEPGQRTRGCARQDRKLIWTRSGARTGTEAFLCRVAGSIKSMTPIPALNQEWLTSFDVRVLTIQRMEAGNWWNYRQVSSPFSRLWLILSGEALVRHHGRRFRLQPGRLHLVPPFTLHDCSCSRSFDHYYLHFVARHRAGIDLFSLFDFDYHISPPNGTLGLFERLESLYPGRQLPCYDPAEEIYKKFALASELAGQDLSAIELLESQALLTLLLTPFLRTARNHDSLHALATNRFLAVQEFIQANMRSPIRLADLAGAARLHPTYFSDNFKKLVGIRPLEYLMRRRIEVAQYLLLTTQASIKEVAFEVGIPDPAYFTRVFTHACKCPPLVYRERTQR
jgi:AraC-like DNA-binding protein/mannose-6-phosphate isomerase-like protein (cupin superfamily)